MGDGRYLREEMVGDGLITYGAVVEDAKREDMSADDRSRLHDTCWVLGVVRVGDVEVWRTNSSDGYRIYNVPDEAIEKAKAAALRQLTRGMRAMMRIA